MTNESRKSGPYRVDDDGIFHYLDRRYELIQGSGDECVFLELNDVTNGEPGQEVLVARVPDDGEPEFLSLFRFSVFGKRKPGKDARFLPLELVEDFMVRVRTLEGWYRDSDRHMAPYRERVPGPEVLRVRERTLIQFLQGETDAAALARELEPTYVSRGPDARTFWVEPAGEPFTLTKAHLIRVCDAVLDGTLAPHLLERIGDCLMMTDSFPFDPADRHLIADVCHQWGAPEIHHQLDVPRVRRFREWLVTGVEPTE